MIKSKSMSRAVHVLICIKYNRHDASKEKKKKQYIYEKAYKILVGKDCGRDHRYDLDVVQTQY